MVQPGRDDRSWRKRFMIPGLWRWSTFVSKATDRSTRMKRPFVASLVQAFLLSSLRFLLAFTVLRLHSPLGCLLSFERSSSFLEKAWKGYIFCEPRGNGNPILGQPSSYSAHHHVIWQFKFILITLYYRTKTIKQLLRAPVSMLRVKRDTQGTCACENVFCNEILRLRKVVRTNP